MPPATAVPSRLTPFRSAILFHGLVALVCTGCVYGVLGFRNFNLFYAFDYTGDSLLHVMAIKAIIEQGWYEHVDRLAAPGILHLEDFPMCDNLCCALVRLLALGTSNPFLIQNILFVGFFPLTAVTAAWSLRRFGLSYGATFLGAILYAMLPYHFLRGTWHLFLAAYFLVPPAIVVMWWTMRGMLCAPRGSAEQPPERSTRRWRLVGSGVICALLGCNAVYYPFFACVLFAAAGMYAFLAQRDWRHGLLAFALAGLIGSLVVVNLLPTIEYVHQHGKSDAGRRWPREAEIYGLKVTQMLLPIAQHRAPVLAELRSIYDRAPLVNENGGASLGLIGSAGLLLLLGWTLCARRGSALGAILDPISVLTLTAILFGTIGGLSSLFALLVSPQVRCYNRISVYIAFFALLATCATLDHLIWRRLKVPGARVAFCGGMLALVAFGIWDQTSPAYVRNYHYSRHAEIDDGRYFAQIENLLPPGAMVFQLPAVAFPEGGDTYAMGDYAHLRGYVQTRTLRWSYGAVKGRPEAGWYEATAALPPDQLLESLASTGFRGLYLDCTGYADLGALELKQLSMALHGAVPLLSQDQHTAFFDLAPHLDALLKGMTFARREAIRHLLGITWKNGFSSEEHGASDTWLWCGHEGDLVLTNDSATAHKAVQIVMGCRTAIQGTSALHLSGDLVHQDVQINDHDGEFRDVVDLPPGQHAIHFTCDGPEERVPGDPRVFVWQAHDPVIRDVTGEVPASDPGKP